MKNKFPAKFLNWLFSIKSSTPYNQELRSRMDKQFGDSKYFYPTYTETKPENSACFLLNDYDKYLGTDKTIEILHTLDESDIYEFSFATGDYSISINELRITNSDNVFCDHQFTWFIFCSHDSTVTVGGKVLMEKIQENWPDWESYVHRI
jgi:hypothetical protein